MIDLPRDIEMNIISKLDIDSRRALGIYTRLKIPKDIKDKLEKTIPSPHRFICSVYSRISLGTFDLEKNRFKYVLHRDFSSSVEIPNGYHHSRRDDNGKTQNYYNSFDEKVNIKLPCQSYSIEHYGCNNSVYIWK